MSILNWPDHLRAAGIRVQEHNNWRNNRPLGNLPDRPKVIWHHDASPVGPSPGALDWIINAYNRQDASAQIWVSYDGVWHFIGSGVAWHTGAVLPGMPDNYSAVGVETDETTGEVWSSALLDSLRRGTAAIMAAEGMDPDTYLHFHKTICKPPGRKSDPEGLDLGSERQTVRAYMSGRTPNPGKPTPSDPNNAAPGGADPKDWWDEMSDSEKAQLLADVAEIKKRLRGSEPTIDSLQALAMGLDAANRQITTLSGAVQDVQDRVRGPKDRPWDQFQELGRRIDGLSPKA